MPSRSLLLARLFAGAALVLACGASREEAAKQARADQWATLERERATLDDLRAQLASARERVESDVAAAASEQALQSEVDSRAHRFLEQLVAFLNENAGAPGERPAPEVAAAIQLKSGEDLLLAREHIERGGDYAKAIDILESALGVDPGNPALEAALAEAKSLRYMDSERFSRVQKGMTEAEVREELGQVKHQNVRQLEDGNGVAWLYAKEGGAAAAVLFRLQSGRFEVDDTNFDAVESAAERAAGKASVEDPAGD